MKWKSRSPAIGRPMGRDNKQFKRGFNLNDFVTTMLYEPVLNHFRPLRASGFEEKKIRVNYYLVGFTRFRFSEENFKDLKARYSCTFLHLRFARILPFKKILFLLVGEDFFNDIKIKNSSRPKKKRKFMNKNMQGSSFLFFF